MSNKTSVVISKWTYSETINYKQPDATDIKFVDADGIEHGVDEAWDLKIKTIKGEGEFKCEQDT